MANAIIDTFDLWTTAQNMKTSNRGLSASNQSLLGIKKLRELILELAVRGKLVSQDPNDEPANELLIQIAKQKSQLFKEGKIKKQDILPEIGENERLFCLPEGWEWTRLGVFAEIKGGKRLPNGHSFSISETPHIYIQVTNMKNGTILKENLKYISKETQSEISKYTINKQDLYITIAGTIGDVGSVPEFFDNMNLTENAAKIIFETIDKTWLQRILSSFSLQNQFIEKTNQLAQPKLALHRILSSAIALPPLAEQHRIVSKVDKLMALCDQLEQQQTNTNEAHQTLVDTLLGILTNADNPRAFEEAWQRISNHFDTLLTTEHSIDQLKQTILQLAVMGKLVAQNPEDEPASELLKKIAKEKVRLVNEGKIKKQSPLPQIPESEVFFTLPKGWVWGRLGNYGIVFSGGSFKSEDFNTVSGAKVIKITNAGVGEIVETTDFLPPHFASEYEQYIVKENDLILALTRPYISSGLKISKCPKSYNNSLLNQRVAAIRLITDVEFVFLYLQSSFVLNLYMERFGNSGLQPNLKISDVTELVLPIPPTSEQIRIVTKVDELFALCDALKERLRDAQALQNQLAVAVVEQAV